MKKMLLGMALVGLAFGCQQSEKQAAISDASATPAAAGSGCCASEMAAECTPEAKAECSEMKTECAEKKVCPVTGEVSE